MKKNNAYTTGGPINQRQSSSALVISFSIDNLVAYSRIQSRYWSREPIKACTANWVYQEAKKKKKKS
jgi:hypothetical protein